MHGSNQTLEDLDKEGRLSNLKEVWKFGNQKGATEKPNTYESLSKRHHTWLRIGLTPLKNLKDSRTFDGTDEYPEVKHD